MILRIITVFLVTLTSGLAWSQSDSIQLDCDHYSNYVDSQVKRAGITYSEIEGFVYETIFAESKADKTFTELFKTIHATPNQFYLIDQTKYKSVISGLSNYIGLRHLNRIFEDQNYNSEYRGINWMWIYAWDYLEKHQIDIQLFSQFIDVMSRNDSYDVNLICNKKAVLILFAKILVDQEKILHRLDFYEKSKPLVLDFYKSGGVDFNTFEKDIFAYLHSFGYNDSTADNQLFSFALYTSDLSFYPLPIRPELRKKFDRYHEKLFSQSAFKMNAGKSAFETKLADLIKGEKDIEDEWFLAVYAGVFKITQPYRIREFFGNYTPNDFRSEGFKAWYYLFILQKIYNYDQVSAGVKLAVNNYPFERDNLASSLFVKTENLENIMAYQSSGHEQKFYNISFYEELFHNPLFIQDFEPLIIQLKIDTNQKAIPSEILFNRPLNVAQKNIITEALASCTFHSKMYNVNGQREPIWLQIRCKRKTKEEEERDQVTDDMIDDIDLSWIEDVPEEVENEPVEIIYDFVEVDPSFPGGAEAQRTFLTEKIAALNIPKNQQVSGFVYVAFVVYKTGKLGKFKIRKGINDTMDGFALEIAKSMPDWIPGKQNGKNVHVNYTLPIRFKFD